MQFSDKELMQAVEWFASNKTGNHQYYHKRVIERLEQLNPLIAELDRKGLFLIDIHQELNFEYNTLNLLKIQYKL